MARALADAAVRHRRLRRVEALPVEQLRALYVDGEGMDPSQPTVAYCRIGERSSHSWFVLTHLLGFDDVRNYDGSWTEWGNLVRAPIEKGEAPPVQR